MMCALESAPTMLIWWFLATFSYRHKRQGRRLLWLFEDHRELAPLYTAAAGATAAGDGPAAVSRVAELAGLQALGLQAALA